MQMWDAGHKTQGPGAWAKAAAGGEKGRKDALPGQKGSGCLSKECVRGSIFNFCRLYVFHFFLNILLLS